VSIVSRDDALVFSILLPATDPAVVFRGLRISMLPPYLENQSSLPWCSRGVGNGSQSRASSN
jgi:hypothetical protein